ncbi:MAG TPA: RHS repeat-associated core domain-containing protein [Cyclobacteriaceae bacterium]|nr:RHS repeat-associated core domain-containing protein [Cyclobacteriaceae bacterium]
MKVKSQNEFGKMILAGNKRTKVAFQGSQIAQSGYVEPIQYECKTSSTVAFLQIPEGRVVKDATGIWNYEYYLKDHLGNNRVVVAYTNDTDEYKATMETASQSTEEAQFKNLPATRLQIATYNHTPKNYLTPTPDRVAGTNGYTNKPIGPAKLIQVRTGDQVTAEVYARYTAGTGGSTAVISNLVAALTGAYGIGTGEAAYSAFSTNLPTIAGGLAANANVPKAYLIYILFSNNFSSYQFGYQMVSTYAQAGPEKLTTSVTVPAGYDNGYLYIYVANESNVASASSVYFDDMLIRHIKAAKALQVTQVTDYYPFGLAINPLGYQKNTTFKNDYLYNGNEFQDDFSLNWLDYGARMYMPETGRWGVIDPMAEDAKRWSPYRYAFDNPMRFVDPDGMFEYTDGYSAHDSKYETGSVEHGGTFEGNKVTLSAEAADRQQWLQRLLTTMVRLQVLR